MSFGVMGGDMQPQGHLQTIVRMLDYKQQPQAACDGPRWKLNRDFTLDVEAAMRADDGGRARGARAQLQVVDDPIWISAPASSSGASRTIRITAMSRRATAGAMATPRHLNVETTTAPPQAVGRAPQVRRTV